MSIIDKSKPIPVPKAVYEGLEAVRKSGETNMLDRPRVIELADYMGYKETANWIRRHKSEYAHLIFQGVQIEENDDGESDGK